MLKGKKFNAFALHQLLCMRISAVMQAHNSCCATGDTNCLNNIFYLFQQHILALPTT